MYLVRKTWHCKDAHSRGNQSINSVKSQSNAQWDFPKNLQTDSKTLLEEKMWRNIQGYFKREVPKESAGRSKFLKSCNRGWA